MRVEADMWKKNKKSLGQGASSRLPGGRVCAAEHCRVGWAAPWMDAHPRSPRICPRRPSAMSIACLPAGRSPCGSAGRGGRNSATIGRPAAATGATGSR